MTCNGNQNAAAAPTAREVGSAEAIVDHDVEHGAVLDGEADRQSGVELLRLLDEVV